MKGISSQVQLRANCLCIIPLSLNQQIYDSNERCRRVSPNQLPEMIKVCEDIYPKVSTQVRFALEPAL